MKQVRLIDKKRLENTHLPSQICRTLKAEQGSGNTLYVLVPTKQEGDQPEGERGMKYFSMFSGIGGFEHGIEKAWEALDREEVRMRTDPRGDMPNIDSQQHREELPEQPISNDQEAKATEGMGRLQQEDQEGRDSRELKDLPRIDIGECVGFSEVDKYAIQIYAKQFKEHKNYGDCTKIDWTEVEDFDYLVGGFPCQAFSIAGKRGGFDDTRGTLFFEVARGLREKQPRICVLENVKGLLSHDKGNTFLTILATLDELGYDCQWQVCNSKNFGVPQNRERVFIIGHLRGTRRPEVFPIGYSNGETALSRGRITNASRREFKWQDRSPCLAARDYKEPKIADFRNDEGVRVRKDDMSPCLSARRHSETDPSTMAPMVLPVITPDRPEKRQNGRRFKEDGDPSFTLTAQDKHGVYDGMKIRRLTPTECERLQAFPDGWTEEGIDTEGKPVKISDTQRYKTLGNAVSTCVIQAIFEMLLKQ